jgi:thiol-disulfide isomerase/thioredoxin
MPRSLLLASLLLGSLWLACTPSRRASVPGGPTGAPLALAVAPAPLSAGQSTFSDAIAGKVVLVDFWATWCAPCRESIPKLIRLHRAYGPDGLVVVGVDVGETPEVASSFAAEAGIDYPLFVDPAFSFADAMGAREVPTMLLVGRDGTVRARYFGLNGGALAEIRALLAEPGSSPTR